MTVESLKLPELEVEPADWTLDEAPVGAGTDVQVASSVDPRFRRYVPLLKPSGYYVVSRIAVAFAALASKWLNPRINPLRVLTTGWDGTWYRMIAEHGYPQRIFNEGGGSRWAFFPAYPALLRGTVATTGLTYSQATLALSFVLGLTSTLAIWLAIREVFGSTVADRSTLLYVFFPVSYVLSMGYTEALFITAAGATLFAISRKYWITASSFAVLASLTRGFGVVLIACLVVAATPIVLRQRKIRPLVAILLSPVGFLAWLLYSWGRVGSPFAFFSSQRIWGDSHFVWFRTPFVALAATLEEGPRAWDDGQIVLAAIAVVFAGVGCFYLHRAKSRGLAIPGYWWVFTIGSILGMLSPYEPVSVLRYALPIFPLFAAYAWRVRHEWEGPIIGLLAVSQGTLALVVFVGSLHPHLSNIWP